LGVDGVISIGEHGDYPIDEMGRHMYPRRYFWEQICGVFASSGRVVPVFNDKHLSYNWDDAWWMYQRGKELNVPMLAGSTLTLCWRNPWLEFDETPITEALAIGFGGMEAYGYHTVETLQCMVERRKGGETGVKSVQCLVGDAVWKAGDAGLWSRELAEAAADRMINRPVGTMEQYCENPEVFLIEYTDGLKAAILQLNGYARDFAFAAKTDKGIESTEFYLQYHREHTHFAYLGLNIEEMFVTGEPPWPVERTLVATGIINAVMDSAYQNHAKISTPGMANLAYSSYDKLPIRPTGFRPTPATLRQLDTLINKF
ncbi:MAG: hypothetical protein QGH20_06235, partial [Candidatus Latescibacteria bacterium]|nr:hypothetical protein [Candidatus Latescibacterota bacterium]